MIKYVKALSKEQIINAIIYLFSSQFAPYEESEMS